MRIAFLVNEFPALSEMFILQQITGLLDRGHDVDIYSALPPRVGKIHADVERYQLLARTTYWPTIHSDLPQRALCAAKLSLELAFSCPRILLEALNFRARGPQWKSGRFIFAGAGLRKTHECYDIIQCHFGTLGLVGSFLKEIGVLSGPMVTAFHGADVNVSPQKWGVGVYNSLFRTPGLFTANSNYTRDAVIRLGCDPARIHILRMGTDPAEFPFRERVLHAEEIPTVLTIGRLTEKKGIEIGIRAIGLLAQRGVLVRYHVVGDGPLRSHLEGVIRDLGLEDRVQLLGSRVRQEVIEELSRAHLFVLPSVTTRDGDREGQGVVLQEAQAAGLPVVATDHNGLPESFLPGVSGYLVPEYDPNALADRLQTLIENPQSWPEMGRSGRRFVESEFDLASLIQKQLAIYERARNLT
ncbi:MAG TPA: glycosyltransferase [Gemmatimonadota bacterium]|nr:glycosyltransferase [Gemmatimonadota bacterium]